MFDISIVFICFWQKDKLKIDKYTAKLTFLWYDILVKMSSYSYTEVIQPISAYMFLKPSFALPADIQSDL